MGQILLVQMLIRAPLAEGNITHGSIRILVHIQQINCYVYFSQDDFVVEHKRRGMLAPYDKYFKKFHHSKALDAALDVNNYCKISCIYRTFYVFVAYKSRSIHK